MAQVEAVEPVKLLVALLWAAARSRDAALEQLEVRWGIIDFNGDLMSRYRKGRYRPLEWAFPDFRDGRYDRDLARIRDLYMASRRERRFPVADQGGLGGTVVLRMASSKRAIGNPLHCPR